ncbi:hypothetical protein [Candidatus Deianiraea vastatrix]|nr:hypothetical protein [Candidatus Deianiraea vastatrix]
MRGIFLHTIYSARRDRFIIGILFGMIIASIIAGFLGSTSIVESDQMRVIYASATCRFIIMIGMMVFISFHIKRLFENKEMDVFLSRIPSRASIIYSFVSSFLLISFVLIAQAVFIMCVIYMQDFVNIMYWGLTLMLEAAVVVTMSLLLSIAIRSSTLGLLMCFGGYFISRVIGNFVAYIDMSKAGLSFNSITEVILKILSVIIPRLDLFAKSDFIVYGSYSLTSTGILLAQAICYSIFITFVAIFDIRMREF